MAQDSFLGAFQGLPPWQLAHAAAASGAPLDALQVQLPPLMGGWDHDMVAMSGSLVSPPSPSPFAAATVGGAHEAALMEQLASRLGISVPSPPPASQYASCYGTPVGSPSKPVAAAASTTAARLPGFTAASAGKLSRVASSQSLLGAQQHLASSPGGVTPHTSDGSSSDGPSRKRKAPPAGGKSGSKAKEVAVTTAAAKSAEAERRAKKGKLSADDADEDDDPKPAAGQRSSGSKGKEVAVAEPPKDYIHVRARRGQATDSHSLAERVRREKISERMKLLQDIVPGCSKVTGKAVMLDEIINYVQSLQRQVEFLSMKLSTVNPRLEVDVDSFVKKDGNQSCVAAPTTSLPPPAVYSMDGSSSAFCYASSPPAVQCGSPNSKSFDTPSTSIVNHHHNIQDNHHSLKGFQNANNPHQIGSLWEEDDLQSLVQMGFRGGCDT